MMNRILSLSVFVAALIFAHSLPGADDSASTKRSEALQAAKKKAVQKKYHLRYQFEPGETVRTKIEEYIVVETTIKGTTLVANSSSISVKKWMIAEVNEAGDITLINSVEKVKMRQKTTGQAEVVYDSTVAARPPAEYEAIAKTIGVPLATITINRYGNIIKRDDSRPVFNPGIANLTVPLHKEPIAIGGRWLTSETLKIAKDNIFQSIKTRRQYRLEKVEAGVAVISVKTIVLTPVNDAEIKSKLIQRLKNGVIRFDIDAGRVLSKEMTLNEVVIGFSGPDSNMKYQLQRTETLLSEENAAKTAQKSKASPAKKDRNGQPVLRR